VYKIFSISLLLLFISTSHFSCINKVGEPDDLSMYPASCKECHTFPGTDYCRNDTMVVNGKEVTSCALCHMGAVVPDSTKTVVEQITQQDTTDTIITVYHDRMVTFHEKVYPATGSLHGNDSVDFNPGQCNKCHGYPPNKGAHKYHINEPKKVCADCHLYTIQCSTYILANKTIYVPKEQKGLGSSVFLLNPEKHLNGFSGDINFWSKVQNANIPGYDTLYLWDPKLRTCSNVACHKPIPDKQHFIKEIWKEVK